jgi:hypothetical protein
MVFEEMIAVYTENHTRPINKKGDLLIVKPVIVYSSHSALKGNAKNSHQNK